MRTLAVEIPERKIRCQRLFFGEAADVDASFGSGGPHSGHVDAGAIVADRDHDLGPDLCRVQPDESLRRLAYGQPLLGELDAMPHRVPHQVQQWRDELLEHTPVNLDVLAKHLPAHFLSRRPRSVTHGAVEDRLECCDGHHPSAFSHFLELVDDLRELAVFGDSIRIQP